MPFRVIQRPDKKYGLQYLNNPNKYTKSSFNSQQAALNAGQRYMTYRKEPNKVIGNKILSKSKPSPIDIVIKQLVLSGFPKSAVSQLGLLTRTNKKAHHRI